MSDFQECDTCRAKPGSPLLCGGCLHNRELIAELTVKLNNARGHREADNPEVTADPEAPEPGMPPVVAALADWMVKTRGWRVMEQVRDHADELADIIAAHQPPDGLKELLAALREFNVARRPNDSKAGILMWDDGSGQTVLPNMISFAADTSSIGKAQWFDGKPGSAAARIRAATEKLRLKLEPEPEPEPTKPLELHANIYPSGEPPWVHASREQCRTNASPGARYALFREVVPTPEPPTPPDYAKMLCEAAPFTLAQAHALLVCRVCGGRYGPRRRPDGTLEPFVLNDGKEFAHADCVGGGPEPAHVWRAPDETTPLDAWVWCRDRKEDRWRLCRLAMCKARRIVWRYVALADPAHLNRMPPADWTPGADN